MYTTDFPEKTEREKWANVVKFQSFSLLFFKLLFQISSAKISDDMIL